MKTLKTFQIAVTITIVSLFIGCSDSFITQNERELNSNQSASSSEFKSKNQVSMKVKLDSYGSYSFDQSNTGFYTFSSIYIPDCMRLSSNYEITGYGDDFAVSLDCDSKDFSVWSITVYNNSNSQVETDIILTGSTTKVKYPKITERDAQ